MKPHFILMYCLNFSKGVIPSPQKMNNPEFPFPCLSTTREQNLSGKGSLLGLELLEGPGDGWRP